MDKKDDLRLDPRKFAQLVVKSHQVSDHQDPEAIVKRKLTLFLTAYYLAERFNQLQNTTFSENPNREEYKALLKKLEEQRFSDW